MKKAIVILSTFFVLFVLSCEQPIRGEIKVISPEEMNSFLQLDNVQLIDVRSLEDHTKEFIPKSQNIDFKSPTFIEDISKLDKNKPVLLYCNTGRRSDKCAQKLLDAGFIKIFDLDGGMSKWKHDGFAVDTKR